MNAHVAFGSLTALILAVISPQALQAADNELTAAEQAEGWRLLFDGRTTSGWRSFKKATFPSEGWLVKEGCLVHPGRAGGGDILTEAKFESFELTWDWRMKPNGNSGLKYFVSEARSSVIGHEYQLLTLAQVQTVQPPSKGGTAGFYDVLPPEIPIQLQPEDQFNTSRVVVRGRQVEHWLNGKRTIAYELGSPAVMAAIARSKFRDVKDFGQPLRGHILLQDHGGEVSFKNIKIRELAP